MKSSLVGVLALGLAALPTCAALAPTAVAAASTTVTASDSTADQTTVTLSITAGTNVRTGPGTTYAVVASLKTGTTVVGTVTGTVSSSSWAQISSPASLAGKYVNVGVTHIVSQVPVNSTPTPPVVTTPPVTAPVTTSPVLPPTPDPTDGQQVTRYTGTATRSYAYASASDTATPASALIPLTAVTGTWDAASGRVHTADGHWVSGTITSNPYNDIETHQWQDVDGLQATATSDQTVTRYVVANRSNPVTRSEPTYNATDKVGSITPGTAITGSYVNSHFFKIASGANAGQYISSGVLFTTPNQTTINGQITSKDLCQAPDSMRFNKDTDDQYLGCEALSQLEVFSAQSPYPTTFWEGYRSLATQQKLYRQLGYPRAAVPGTSNHGLGEAVDIHYTSPSILSFSSPQVVDMMKNGGAFGWVKPAYMSQGGANPEAWHFEFLG